MRQFLSLLIVVFIVSGAIFLTYAKKEPDPQENTDITQTQDGDGVDTTVPQEPEDEISRGEKPVIPTQPDDTQDPEEGTGETAGGQTDGDAGESAGTPAADCGTVVPKSGAVELDYFDDAVFIGDSRTERQYIYTG